VTHVRRTGVWLEQTRIAAERIEEVPRLLADAAITAF
jgi:hypothetical protein